mgnify:CR=1 FL=1
MRLRFWIVSGLQTFAAAIGACGFYALLMYIQLGSNVQDLLSTIPVYLLAFGGMMLMVMNIGVYKFHLHLALSFGSTRNEAILGLNLFRLIPAVLMAAVLTAMTFLPGSDFLPFTIGIFLHRESTRTNRCHLNGTYCTDGGHQTVAESRSGLQ